MLTFKRRQETTQICIVVRDCKQVSLKRLYAEARRRGQLDTGFHIYIGRNGSIMYDRDINAIAQYNFPDNETSIYILCDSGTGKVTDAQKICIDELEELYEIPSKIVELEGE